MPAVNWEMFERLPGAQTDNFERLCRSLIRRHYGSFGVFAALANQPGVEFHLQLDKACALGEVGRWWGWQCRWFELPAGRALGPGRRQKIKTALETTARHLPGLTDWVLWTRRPLTAGDQRWFQGLSSRMRLHLWTALDADDLLSGPAELLRATYFGELVLTPDILDDLHARSVGPVRSRWVPELHQTVSAERFLRRALGEETAWSQLGELASSFTASADVLQPDGLPQDLSRDVAAFAEHARLAAGVLLGVQAAIGTSDWESLRTSLGGRLTIDRKWAQMVRQLRNRRSANALSATNLLADLHEAKRALHTLGDQLNWRMVAVVADAGHGKTQLAAQLTSRSDKRPAGVLLHGRDLQAGGSLDDLGRRLSPYGTPIPSFEALVAAVDAAGQRAGHRLPIVIDGLNEAEDPRDWKPAFSVLNAILPTYPHVLLVCTLRSAFFDDACPDGTTRVTIDGFGGDRVDAVRKYFKHFKIEPSDAELPWQLFNHPLTLRMFCEVTNPQRERPVGTEAMPGSLTALFDRHLEQVAARIQQLSARAYRHYAADVRSGIAAYGKLLWRTDSRSAGLGAVRHQLADNGRPWDQSLVRALEDEGVLLRDNDQGERRNQLVTVYDALGGHIIADALIEEHGGGGFEDWVKGSEASAKLFGDYTSRHPLADDIVKALAGLMPRRLHRRQLWTALEGIPRREALYEAAYLEGTFLDGETVREVAEQTRTGQAGARGSTRDLFDRLWSVRAAIEHPLNAQFLDFVLRDLRVWERDLRWSEWLRTNHVEVIKDFARLAKRWREYRVAGPREQLLARWVMWALCSTVRPLRDEATHALYWYGCADPHSLFELTVESLSVNDPYVLERMLAACYGVAMALWTDPNGDVVRERLPGFVAVLLERMFSPGNANGTRHALTRDYALGVIGIAQRIQPAAVPAEKRAWLVPPFDHLPVPFKAVDNITDADVAEAQHAIGMDFGNYTIGRLIPNRGNYDFKNREYVQVRRQIEARIVVLGYSDARFGTIDREIAEKSWRAEMRGERAADRYGKKYSWISYFEMYGLRADHGRLEEHRPEERTSDVDIDPSFPQPPRLWESPPFGDLYANAPRSPKEWLRDGPVPKVAQFLEVAELDGERGPWVLVHGYLEQSARRDARRVFSFVDGFVVAPSRVAELARKFNEVEFPGNASVPKPLEHHYLFGGEIPWSPRYRRPNGQDQTASRDVGDAFYYHDGKRWRTGIPVELLCRRFSWESYHSTLNQVSGVDVPAPALCDRFRLVRRQGEWDLFDQDGRRATLFRKHKADGDTFGSHWFYIRADLLKRYLKGARQLVWLVFGERGFEAKTSIAMHSEQQDMFWGREYIHRSVWRWNGQEPGRSSGGVAQVDRAKFKGPRAKGLAERPRSKAARTDRARAGKRHRG